jgi:uncharacterized phiE125 gp8 family phage protein
MPTGLSQLSAPTEEPVTVAEMRQHLRHSDETDTLEIKLISGLIKAARRYVEDRTGLQLMTATWLAAYDRFPRYSQLGGLQYASETLWSQRVPQTELSGRYWPDRASFRLPRPPLQGVASIVYVAGISGNTLVVDPATYLVDTSTMPGRIAPTPGSIWPIVKQQLGAVQITFTSGFGTRDQVPETLKLVIRLLVGHWYETREAVVAGNLAKAPFAVDTLLDSEWTGELF